MNDAALHVLESAERQSREGGAALPDLVLDAIGRETGARNAVLGCGTEILARWCEVGGGAASRIELNAGRDVFWLELTGGNEPDPALGLAARTALSSWSMREELKKARFAERRRLWEVESLRAIAEVLGGTLEPAQIALGLGYHGIAIGVNGICFSAAGICIGICLFLIPYLLGGMGAGDAKLMGAAGALLGAKGVILAALLAIVFGGIYAMVLLMIHHEYTRSLLRRLGIMVKTLFVTCNFILIPPAKDESNRYCVMGFPSPWGPFFIGI